MNPRGSVGVAGAGLAGSLMATMLANDGYDVTVYERRPDPRPNPEEGGRSINLALSHRGIRALDGIGITEAVLETTVPMKGRLMHGVAGERAFQPYGTEESQAILSVSRAGLNRMLLDAAEEGGARLRFDTRVRDLRFEDASLSLDDGEAVTHDFIVGADGAYSAVRARMQRRAGFDYSQSYLVHGYKELSMPALADGSHALEREALHIWPRGGYMMIALPNADGTYTCTLFWPMEGPVSFGAVETREQIEAVFHAQFPDVPALIPDLVDQYQTNPTGSLVTVRCGPWHHADKVILIGDAAHAVVPFYGQGMNASFEDCRLLREQLASSASRAEAFEAFSRSRRVDTDALADLAIDNYITMRDRVASRAFLVGRAVGRAAHRVLPSVFIPLYTLVTFTSVPYAEAQQRWLGQVRLARRAAWTVLILALLLLIWFIFGR